MAISKVVLPNYIAKEINGSEMQSHDFVNSETQPHRIMINVQCIQSFLTQVKIFASFPIIKPSFKIPVVTASVEGQS